MCSKHDLFSNISSLYQFVKNGLSQEKETGGLRWKSRSCEERYCGTTLATSRAQGTAAGSRNNAEDHCHSSLDITPAYSYRHDDHTYGPTCYGHSVTVDALSNCNFQNHTSCAPQKPLC